eukprot:2758508-Rhodomonas_salina.3
MECTGKLEPTYPTCHALACPSWESWTKNPVFTGEPQAVFKDDRPHKIHSILSWRLVPGISTSRTEPSSRRVVAMTPHPPSSTRQSESAMAGAEGGCSRGGKGRGVFQMVERGSTVMVVLAAVALVGCVLLLRGGEGRTELVGASDFNSVSGQTHVFWGEDPELHVGRYPPEYARQMKQMRLLMKRLKQTNLESK